MTIWYSVDGNHFTTDSVEEIKADAINSALWADDVTAGDELSYTQGVRYDPKPSDFTKDIAWCIIEQIECSADDECGEWAEGVGRCSAEALDELNDLVSEWADKHLSVDCFIVKDTKEVSFILTQEELDEHMK